LHADCFGGKQSVLRISVSSQPRDFLKQFTGYMGGMIATCVSSWAVW